MQIKRVFSGVASKNNIGNKAVAVFSHRRCLVAVASLGGG